MSLLIYLKSNFVAETMLYQVRALAGLPGYRTPDPASMLGSSQLAVTPSSSP